MRLAKADGVSMGEMARGIGVDPSYITALVDDLDARGLARREPAPDDRRVKIIVLTDDGPEAVATRSTRVLSVPPAAFAALSQAELRQLRDLLDKVLAARRRRTRRGRTQKVAAAPCRRRTSRRPPDQPMLSADRRVAPVVPSSRRAEVWTRPDGERVAMPQ